MWCTLCLCLVCWGLLFWSLQRLSTAKQPLPQPAPSCLVLKAITWTQLVVSDTPLKWGFPPSTEVNVHFFSISAFML